MHNLEWDIDWLSEGQAKAKPEWRRIVTYWRAAAKAGHARAQFYLGTCFDWGQVCPAMSPKQYLVQEGCSKWTPRRPIQYRFFLSKRWRIVKESQVSP